MKLIFSILLLLCASASAQTATELFNPAAREYIVGNTAAASNLVTQALQKYPSDEKLQKLRQLIEQQQQQNQQNQDQQNQDQQQNQDKQQQDQNQQNQDQPDSSDQSDTSDQQDQQDQQKEEQQDSGEQDPQEAQPSEAQPLQAGQMTEEEARQLLDAMKQNEKDERTDLRPILGRPVHVDKDW